MPGPITLPTTLPNIFGDLGDIIRQARHPVYNSLGQQVGSYTTLDALCQGQWLKFTGVAQPPASQLYVRNFWGKMLPLSTQCVAAAKATARGGSITQPQPVQPASAAKAVVDSTVAATSGDPAAIDLAAMIGAADARDLGLQDVDGQVLQGMNPTTLAIYGGAAVLALALIFGGGDSRRRR